MSADLKNVFRQLRRSPGFALTAILTLALGIGAFGVSAWNPLVLCATTSLLASVALVAAAVPAIRAAGVEPMEALRGE